MKTFSKILAVWAIVLLPTLSFCVEAKSSKNGAFVGVDFGWMADFLTNNDGTTTAKTDTFPYGLIGLKLGYNYYFSNRLGVRGYVDYGYGFHTTNESGATNNTNIHQLAINADVLVNIFSYKNVIFGAYAGLGFGYSGKNTEAKSAGTTTITDGPSGVYIPINLGISANIEQNHRVDIGVKIQTFQTSINNTTNAESSTTGTDKLRTLNFGIGYQYLF